MVSALVPTLPVVLTNGAGKSVVAGSAAEYWNALWSGYTVSGPVPAPPRNKIPATLADLDGLKGAAPTDLDTLKEVSDELKGRLAQSTLSATYAGINSLDSSLAPAAVRPARAVKTLAQTFQSGHGWSFAGTAGAGQSANDTSDFAIGSQCYKIVTNGAGASANIYKWNTTSVDFTGKNIAVLVKVTGSAHLKTFQVQLGTGGTMANNNTFAPMNVAATDEFMGEGVWTWVVIPWRASLTSGTGVARNNVTDFQINVVDDNTGNLVTVRVQALAAVPISPAYTVGVVTFGLDDGFASAYTSARPALAKYGYAADCYPVCEAIDSGAQYMTTAQVQELQNTHGWMIGAHADTWANHNTPLSSFSEAALKAAIRTNRDWLTSRGLIRGTEFLAYPGGFSEGTNALTARRFFAGGRTVGQRTRETLPPSDPMRLRIFLLQASVSLATAKLEVDAAKAGNFWLIFTAHDLVAGTATGGSWAASDFAQLVDYVNSQGVPVKTTAEVFATA